MMSALRYFFILLLCVFSSSCFSQEVLSRHKAPLLQEGEVVLYLQPMPQEAQKLRFIIDGIFAIRDDGFESPFILIKDELNGAELIGIQRRLASAILPPGIYSGISIRFKQAFIQTEEGDVALLVANEPIRVKRQFDVTRRNASTLFLSLNAAGNVNAGVRFTPGFSLASSGRVLINLNGYVTNTDSNFISVFNKKTMQVVDTIATGQGPMGLVIDQLRGRA
jgi:YVTN family beta-propeller protein